MYTPLACSDYYGASAPPRGHQSTTDLPMTRPDARPGGRPRTVPAFTITRSTREMPSSTPTASPRLRRRPSTWPPHRRHITGFGVDPHHRRKSRAAIRPTSTRLEPATRYGASPLVPHVHLLVSLAGPGPSGSTDPSRRCQGCLPPSRASPRSDYPQLHRPAATDQRRVLSPRPVSDGASRRTVTSCRTTVGAALNAGPRLAVNLTIASRTEHS
jgi:hypothetical protein